MKLENEIIRASAGSGKTHELVRRYIRLLARGVKPEHIATLTFTRKAAGEFFERILQKLADLATATMDSETYVEELLPPPLGQNEVLRLIRSMVASMDRLRMGTIDSFFASMVQCSAFELGLSGQANIMPEEEINQVREDLLDALLLELTQGDDTTELRDMMSAWKRATAGRDEGHVSQSLGDWLESLHPTLASCPDSEQWGQAKFIWTDPKAAVHLAKRNLVDALQHLSDHLPWGDYERKHKSSIKLWEENIARLREFQPGSSDAKLRYFFDPDRGDPRQLRAGGAPWKVHRAVVELNAVAGGALMDVLEIMIGQELALRCERTAGRFGLLSRFERLYAQKVRSRGRLTFADLTAMLSGDLRPPGVATAEEWRQRWADSLLHLQFRLDASYRHWLFDEFQDTNLQQWKIVENMVDEAAQDPERSFFVVGDLKQSIYLWREAEPQLFLDVENKYRGVRLRMPKLNHSQRSSQEVLDMVNGVFTKQDILRAQLPGAMQWWSFDAHESAKRVAHVRGHAALLSVEPWENEDAEGARDRLLVAMLRDLRPLERGMSCAVLVRRNKEARRLSSHLRQVLGVEVVCESEEEIATDNSLALALLHVLKVAAHPDDDLAWEHLCMTPLTTWMEEFLGEGKVTQPGLLKGRLGREVRHQLAKDGFLHTMQIWSDRLRHGCEGGVFDAFSEWRLRQLLDLASHFDATGSRDIDAFLRFATNYRLRSHRQSSALNVMTIHKSKGLEFDVVILAELQGDEMDSVTRMSMVTGKNAADRSWLLDKPSKAVCTWAGLPEKDPLRRAMENAEARAGFESLCRLYVAMTRARRGLYAIFSRIEKIKDGQEAKLLLDTLGDKDHSTAYEVSGEIARCWYEQGDRANLTKAKPPTLAPALSPRPAQTATSHSSAAPAVAVSVPHSTTPSLQYSNTPRLQPAPLSTALRSLVKPIQRRTPSGEEAFTISGHDLLSPRRNGARQMGVLVHALFAEVPWVDGQTPEILESLWKAKGWDQSEGYSQASELVKRTLAAPNIRPWFEKGSQAREVWMERSFEVMEKGHWISGIVDRVVLERDGAGYLTSAVILDFKTDEVQGDEALQERAESYRPQIELYTHAVSRLTGLGEGKIKRGLIFTAAAEVRWLG